MHYYQSIHYKPVKRGDFVPVKTFEIKLLAIDVFNLCNMRDAMRLFGSCQYNGLFCWTVKTEKTLSEISAQLTIYNIVNFEIKEI